MKSIILFIVVPEVSYSSPEEGARGVEFLQKTAEIAEKAADIQGIGRGVWLIQLGSTLPFLADILAHARKASYPHRIFASDSDIQEIDLGKHSRLVVRDPD